MESNSLQGHHSRTWRSQCSCMVAIHSKGRCPIEMKESHCSRYIDQTNMDCRPEPERYARRDWEQIVDLARGLSRLTSWVTDGKSTSKLAYRPVTLSIHARTLPVFFELRLGLATLALELQANSLSKPITPLHCWFDSYFPRKTIPLILLRNRMTDRSKTSTLGTSTNMTVPEAAEFIIPT